VRDVKYVDILYILSTRHRAQLINSHVKFEQLSTMTENVPLRDFVALDAASTLEINWGLFYWWGSGPLEGTGRIQVNNVYLQDEPKA
jgi:hypothetical protein